MMPNRFEAVLFDLGNTLIYFNGAWPEVIGRADEILFQNLAAAGIRLDRAPFLAAFRRELDAYYRERESEFIEQTTQYVLSTLLQQWGYPDVHPSILRPALDAMYAVSQEHWLPEPDAIATLTALRGRGYRLGLISNAGDDQDVQTLVDRAQLRPCFDTIVSSAALGLRKPNPAIFRYVLEPWGIPPARAAMVGDTLGADILGAQNAGVYSIWITRRAGSPGNLAHADTIHPDAVISSLTDLLTFL